MKNVMIYLFLTHQSDRKFLSDFLTDLGYTVKISTSITLEKWLQSDLIILDEMNVQRVNQEILTARQHLNSLFLPAVILISHKKDEIPLHPIGKIDTSSVNAPHPAACQHQLEFDAVLQFPVKKEELSSQLSILTHFKKQYEVEYRLIFENIDIGIYRLSSDKQIVLANKAFAKLLGYEFVDKIMHKTLPELGINTSNHHDTALKEIQSTGHAMNHESVWTRHDGSDIYVLEGYIAFTSEEGPHYYYATTIQDITTRKIAEASLIDSEKRITYMAHHDSLTDLYNREKLDLVLNGALLKAKKNQTQVACIYIDLDWFKSINASCGHHIGDKVLREVANRIKNATRITDLIARVGPDEFVVVLTQLPFFNETLSDVINQVRDLMKKPFIIDNHTLHVKTSIGISIYPSDAVDAVDADTLFKNAYTAMYSAKKNGGDKFEFCSPGLSKRVQYKTILDEQLRGALSNNEFYVHFQPKVELKSNQITGVEALLRWKNPVLGEMPPNYFIPLAEEIGLITPITEIMFAQVCQHINQWKKEKRPPLNVAINLSGKSFIDLKFMDVIARILKQHRIDPKMITIEITESVLMQEIESSANILKQFTDMGLKISIDDFGTGYSSLNYLKYFTIDSLKIDQSFVRDLTIDSSDSLIVDAIISIAHSLKFKVIAEGVETKEQWDFLKQHGCDEIQGFYFCKPMLPDDMIQFVEQKH